MNSFKRTRLYKYFLYRYFNGQCQQFVPKHNPVNESDIKLLKNFVFTSQRLLILTGAGISTESGIPDYRSDVVGLYARTNHKPIQHQEFIKSKQIRQRYWARNFIGWYRFSQCEPNSVHYTIRDLEIEHKIVNAVITQNVDSLHYKAGSKNVIELHGSGYRVICLQCSKIYNRFYIQEKLLEKNNIDFNESTKMIRPDGDVEIPEDIIKKFHPPICEACSGVLKPEITFFGDNVPKERVDNVRDQVSNCDSLLILGSSLSVFSGYRIVLQALEENKNILIINIGPTRADKHGILKIEAKCGDILPKIC